MTKTDGKAAARTAIWDALTERKAARFPFPVHGRIPNFAGAREAAERLLAHPVFEGARVIKVNPDSPQRWVRRLALERGITVITPTPRLAGAFRKLDPKAIPAEHYDEAATIKHSGKFGTDLALDALPRVDLVVMGSVAVTRAGHRLGKGHGYADLEYALLRELGNPPVPVVTTVHPLQVLDAFPTEAHDLPVSIIATPEEIIEVRDPPAPPAGIDWDRLPARALEEMPVLAELRELLRRR
ncbi:MAG: 5-formyltetrahydrofolate cyclo-ligase [Gammaproteobacteria bacterium]|nr:5-formyltetrahydrofolate cyclo-ligase [Gammaproteobacteria bacterium]